jgi:hypothetical protein
MYIQNNNVYPKINIILVENGSFLVPILNVNHQKRKICQAYKTMSDSISMTCTTSSIIRVCNHGGIIDGVRMKPYQNF